MSINYEIIDKIAVENRTNKTWKKVKEYFDDIKNKKYDSIFTNLIENFDAERFEYMYNKYILQEKQKHIFFTPSFQ